MIVEQISREVAESLIRAKEWKEGWDCRSPEDMEESVTETMIDLRSGQDWWWDDICLTVKDEGGIFIKAA